MDWFLCDNGLHHERVKLVTIEDICKEIRVLDASKATQSDDIPTKIIKNNSGHFF